MRVAVPPELSAFIAARVAGYPTEEPERVRWAAPYVAAYGALPVYHGWVETLGLRPDGEVVRWSTEGEYTGVRPVEDRTWLLTALVEGARRYRELAALVPERPPGAVDYRCRSHPMFVSGQVSCGECGGVGWLPPRDAAEPVAGADPARGSD